MKTATLVVRGDAALVCVRCEISGTISLQSSPYGKAVLSERNGSNFNRRSSEVPVQFLRRLLDTPLDGIRLLFRLRWKRLYDINDFDAAVCDIVRGYMAAPLRPQRVQVFSSIESTAPNRTHIRNVVLGHLNQLGAPYRIEFVTGVFFYSSVRTYCIAVVTAFCPFNTPSHGAGIVRPAPGSSAHTSAAGI